MREAAWLQHTRAWIWRADDLQAAFAGLATFQEPFDRWGREKISDVHGIDLAQGFPPPEHLVEYRRGR